MLLDKFNRKINYLRISVTDRCNLRCVYCIPEEGIELLPHKEILTFEEIERVATLSAMLGVDKIRITGGEPLVRTGVENLISKLVKIEGIKDVGLTTNGVLLSELAEPLREAGLRRVNVSLDTLSFAKFSSITRGGDLNRVLKGIEKALGIGFNPVKINVVAFRGYNDDEIETFGKLALEKPLQIRFIEHMPVNCSSSSPFVSEKEILEKLARVDKLEEIPNENCSEPARKFRFLRGVGEIGVISPISNKFCGSCNRLRLNPDGKLQGCLLEGGFTDIRHYLRNGATDSVLMEIIKQAVAKKPAEHSFESGGFRKCARAMPIVGG